ncbi:MAG: VTC domain-containing protein [Planctomycetes bacterium]|nr:VTC domain-containing protein [Planctomycetota bacterium]
MRLLAGVHIHTTIDGAAGLAQRFERKFFVLPRNIDFAYALLRQFCRLDSEYPKEQINSLYFDTEDLDEHLKSSSGDFRKNKVRIRWYHRLDDYRETVPVFLELKSREGFAGSKKRQKLPVPVDRLKPINLFKGIIPGVTLMDTIASFGHYPKMPLHPIIVISYWRYRFTELLTGMRVNLDCNIRSTIVKRSLGYGERELKLAGGVIEVKGHEVELPVTLRRMSLLDIDWSRFSKYSSCLDSHLSEPGTMARLWPSGRIAET